MARKQATRIRRGSLRAQFLAFDTKLERLGVPPLTDWWRDGIGRWLDAYETGGALELWGCVGRGSAKSTALYKLALFFVHAVAWEVPPGERHFAIVLSRLVGEASKGISIIAAWMRLLGIRHHVSGDVIELVNLPLGVRVVAASVAAASGWRAVFVGKDERSKWPIGGVEELDAEEIDASAAAMTATHAHAPVVSFGSAWGMFGSFFEAIKGGTSADRVVLGPAPTWVAAPHITEESTRRKERDSRRWAREYKCVFQAGAMSAFDVEDIERAFTPRAYASPASPRVLIIDASSGRVDTFAYAVVRLERDHEPSTAEILQLPGFQPKPATLRLRFEHIDGITATQARQLGSEGIVARLAQVAKDFECDKRVHGDQREEFALRSEFRRHRLDLVVHNWTASSKPAAVETVRRWLRDGLLILPEHETLRREMLQFEEKITSQGEYTFAARGSGHDDYVSLLVTAAMATLDGHVRARPLPSQTRVVRSASRIHRGTLTTMRRGDGTSVGSSFVPDPQIQPLGYDDL